MKTCFIYAVLILLISPNAFSSPFCNSLLLNAHIKKMIGAEIPPLMITAKKAGLPTQKETAQVYPSDGEILLHSDLGPSRWKGAELEDWFSLAPYMEDQNLAQAELHMVGKNSGYCPPGILPALCDALRESREARAEAFRRVPPTSPDQAVVRDFLEMLFVVHEERGLLNFTWGTDLRYWPLDLAPYQAQEIMQILARETLIRHLQIAGLDGTLRMGTELPLETRLILAMVPMIVPLAPFFHIFPLDLPDRFQIGNIMSMWDLQLLELPLGGDPELHSELQVSLDPSKSPMHALEVSILTRWIEGEEDEKYHDPREELRRETLKKLNEYAAEFRQTMDLRQNISVSANDWDMGTLNLQVKGLSRLHQILFYYYVGEKLGQ
jgi:hypothetical protein